MNATVKTIDNQIMVALPADAVARLRLSDGGEVGIIASPNGVELVSDLELARQLEVARGVMRDDHDALRELAK
ncbi:MAG: AbrB/MazE/SpoVT family DNA-binding domain-containing protein [Planctomycetota bacterium]